MDKDAQGNDILTEGGARIRILDENSREDVTDEILFEITTQHRALGRTGKPSKKMLVGSWGGQFSGDASCIMAYTNAGFFRSTEPDVRWRVAPAEGLPPVAPRLCTTADGTLVNAPGHLPESHHGPAAPGFGNCARQILVNDAYMPTRTKSYPPMEPRR